VSEDVKISTRLWSQEVAIANAKSGYVPPPREPGYQFSNGRKFDDGLGTYEPLVRTST
jgi:hypothetical protein